MDSLKILSYCGTRTFLLKSKLSCPRNSFINIIVPIRDYPSKTSGRKGGSAKVDDLGRGGGGLP